MSDFMIFPLAFGQGGKTVQTAHCAICIAILQLAQLTKWPAVGVFGATFDKCIVWSLQNSADPTDLGKYIYATSRTQSHKYK